MPCKQSNYFITIPAAKEIAHEMSYEIQQTNTHGIAFLINLPCQNVIQLENTFRYRFRFTVCVWFGAGKRDLACIMHTVGQHVQYPRSDFPMVVFFTENWTEFIDISRDIVEPLLPPNAPRLCENPKIFFINKLFAAWSRKDKYNLCLPSGGNYILFHSKTAGLPLFRYVYKDIAKKLEHSYGSVEVVMEEIYSPSKTIVSHLNKPVFTNPVSGTRSDISLLDTHATAPPTKLDMVVLEQGVSSLALHSPSKTHDTKTLSSQSEFNRNVQLKVSTEEEKFLPGSRGMAFVVGISKENSSQLSNNLVKEHVTLLSQTFHTVGFAVFEKIGTTKAVLKDIVSKFSNLPNSQDYPIVLVAAGAAYRISINTSDIYSSDRNVDIRKDIVEPFLPPLAPHIADNPKIFLINTFTSPSEFTPLATADLDLLPEGNFLRSYTHTDNFSDLSKTYQSELTQSTDPLEEVLIRVNDKLSLLSTKRLISHLTKPVHLVLVDQASTSKE